MLKAQFLFIFQIFFPKYNFMGKFQGLEFVCFPRRLSLQTKNDRRFCKKRVFLVENRQTAPPPPKGYILKKVKSDILFQSQQQSKSKKLGNRGQKLLKRSRKVTPPFVKVLKCINDPPPPKKNMGTMWKC